MDIDQYQSVLFKILESCGSSLIGYCEIREDLNIGHLDQAECLKNVYRMEETIQLSFIQFKLLF